MLNDSSEMPIGKYKGMKMMSVPASHLDWLYDQHWIVDYPELRQYIERNLDAIRQELEDES